MPDRVPRLVEPIGEVRRHAGRVEVEIDAAHRSGLHALDGFSHAIVLWWAAGEDRPDRRAILTTTLPYAPGVEAGVFACRSEYRPNPIGVTVCPLRAVDEAAGIVEVADIDAFDGTPVVDIKPYIPVTDRVREIVTPAWFDGWPEWLPEEGLGLFEEGDET